ncbi:MAG: ParB N-terminal domain-containing protein, partial [Acetatifactor sp.]|nr:ParB N-terminal domain-containing protein [Acetatifactor sp.]
EYDVWGNLAVCEERVPNRFLFTGQQYDPVTQQYYLRARFYNPVIARFTQEDTYRGDGLNLYAYCRNNPVCYVDPSGHWCDNKEQIYQRLAAEQPADSNVSQLELMARAANIAKGKESGPGETIILRDLSKDNIVTNPSAQISGNSYDIDKLQRTQPYTRANIVSGLMERIAQNGPNSVDPIAIRVHNGQVLVVDGHHRLEAFRQLGYDRVPIRYLHSSQLGKTYPNGAYYRSLEELLDGLGICE